MRKLTFFENNQSARLVMRRSRIPLYLLFLLLFTCGAGYSQIYNENYVFDLGDFKGVAEDTVRMPLQMENIEAVGGYLYRIEYPKAILTPCTLGAVAVGATIMYDSVEMVGRGLDCTVIDSIPFYQGLSDKFDTIYNVTATHDPGDDSMHVNAIFVQFLPQAMFPPEDPQYLPMWRLPTIAAEPDTVTTIAYVLFTVNDTVTTSTTPRSCVVRNYRESDPPPDYRDNQASDEEGLYTYYPVINNIGIFRAQPEDPFNPDTCTYGYDPVGDTCWGPPPVGAPTVSIVGSTSYILTQGDPLPTVTVNAVADEASHQLTLLASNLPEGATFSPSNPVTGTGNVTGTLDWTPSFTQDGVFVINFRATDEDNGLLSDIKSISVTVEKLDIDRLFTTSAYGASPVGGIPGATPVIFPIDLITSKTVYGIQFDMSYPGDMAKLDSVITTSRTSDYIVYDNIGVFPDTVRVMTFGLANEVIGPPDTISGTSILDVYFSIDSAAVPGNDYLVQLYDAWESADPDPLVPSLPLLTDAGIIQVDILGDVNLDKMINVADPVSVVGYIIGSFGFPKRNYETANVVPDVMVNVVDLVGIVNLAFGLPISPSPVQPDYGDDYARLSVQHDQLYEGQFTKLSVRGEFPDLVAGIQLQVDYDPDVFNFGPPELAESIDNFTLGFKDDKQGRIRMVLYSNMPWKQTAQIPAGISEFVYLPVIVKQGVAADDKSKVRLTQAFLSNSNAGEIPVEGSGTEILPTTFTLYQNYPNPFNPTTRIDFDINAGSAGGLQPVKLKIFNILGQHVKTLVDKDLAPGRHTVEWNGKAHDGRQVATGIYLYKLEVGDYYQTRKMLLLK
ncbi:MAG: T9SS type A sorting domain-containing protein [Candidatus Zixiibacteriota bacterium]|nr:MAG: T9SS type A sorting domain-containing protein [candidate division Zixibacteria bacterium]